MMSACENTARFGRQLLLWLGKGKNNQYVHADLFPLILPSHHWAGQKNYSVLASAAHILKLERYRED